MIKPMPFCPSFDPCPKLTPVQVTTSSERIQSGGGVSFSGALYRSLRFTRALVSSNKPAAQTKPTSGEMSSVVPTSEAFAQLTPSPKT